jgi:hypothetical protein
MKMNTTMLLALVVAMTGLGCQSKPTAADVCKKLERAGVAKGCKQSVPAAVNARAKEEYVFNLAAPAGKTGHVLSFEKDDDYDATVKAYEAMAMLAGSHRYGSAKARIFVQLNSGASLATGKKAKAVVDGL